MCIDDAYACALHTKQSQPCVRARSVTEERHNIFSGRYFDAAGFLLANEKSGFGATDQGVGNAVIARSAFVTESKVNASFEAFEADSGDNLVLRIEIDSIGTVGTFRSEGFLMFAGFFWIQRRAEIGLPATAFSRFRYQLIRGNDLLLADVVSKSFPINQLEKDGGNARGFRSFYNASLVNALSETLKSNVASIVEAIDLYLIDESLRGQREVGTN